MHFQSAAIISISSVLFAACSSVPANIGSDLPSAPPPNVAATGAAAPETQQQAFDRIVKKLAAKSIYFDYDDYTLKPVHQSLIKEDYELLKSLPSLSITLEGNADERGSHEHNLALGQKRAETVRRALSLLGIPETRVEAVSYGEERPRATCAEEKCWSANRRVDFAPKPNTTDAKK